MPARGLKWLTSRIKLTINRPSTNKTRRCNTSCATLLKGARISKSVSFCVGLCCFFSTLLRHRPLSWTALTFLQMHCFIEKLGQSGAREMSKYVVVGQKLKFGLHTAVIFPAMHCLPSATLHKTSRLALRPPRYYVKHQENPIVTLGFWKFQKWLQGTIPCSIRTFRVPASQGNVRENE